MERVIFHIDVNSAFLSWEAARRVAKGETDLRLIPAAIGGNREKRNGIILAKSIPAKQRGVKTGEPVGMALSKCPELYIAPPDFALYERNSRAFMEICRQYTPAVEQFSVDECFLDMTGTEYLYPQPRAAAVELAGRIRSELGFTVNIGIASNKLLAKMASDFEKPDRIHTLFPSEIPQKMWGLPAGALFTVGANTAERLRRAHIMSIGELAHTDLYRLQRLVGARAGLHLHRFSNGIDESPVLSVPPPAKGYSNSTTLEEDIITAQEAYRVLLALSERVTARMRAEHARAFRISVSIRSAQFHDASHQRKLYEPTDITEEVYNVSCQLFNELWDRHTPLRLLGISLSDVTREQSIQLSMFSNRHAEHLRELDRTVDGIRMKHGNDKLVRGSILLN